MKKILGFLILMVICCINLTADLNEGLVAHYPFSGNANDESGNGNNGTVNGATLTNDRFGNEDCAYSFDGEDDYIDINIFNLNSFTISLWMKSSQTNFPHYGANLFSNQIARHLIRLNSDGMIYLSNNPSVINDNEWHFIVIAINNSFRQCFVDNVFSEYNFLGTFNGETVLGFDYGYGSYYSGIIDDVRIYNRALSDEEIQELYNPFNANFISPETAYIGEEIQFTDTSTGNPTTWEWDFENDGIYDSFIQNPIHEYTEEGIYSVKLKISNGTLIDSLIKENLITVSYCPPASPQNVNVEIVHPDAIISWAEVDTTNCGSIIIPDGYVVKYSENEEDYFYLWFTTETNFTHSFVTEYSPQMFYEVFTIKNYNREQIEYLERLNNSQEKLKWSEVRRNLETKK